MVQGQGEVNMDQEDRTAVELALGRIFRLGSRPPQPGDVADYERCRKVIMDVLDPPPYAPPVCWAQDRNKGAAGD
jgi:hypothetical protein